MITLGTPTVSNITSNTAQINNNIISNGGATVTARGVQYSTTPNPDQSVNETGSFAIGTFTENLSNLTDGQVYYVRTYATNSQGTVFSSWVTFTTLAKAYSITINGVDRTKDVQAQSITIEDNINDKADRCTFTLADEHGLGFANNEQEVIITLDNGTRVFGGIIIKTSLLTRKQYGVVFQSIECTDYVRLLDSNLVHETFENLTDAQIINDIVQTYCSGEGITTNNVLTGVTIDQISFNYIQPSQALRKIADLTGRNWYVDYNKDLHYFPTGQNAAPFNIIDSSSNYYELQIDTDSSQLKNRVYVRGGTKLSDPTTYSVKGDGATTKFVLPDKPHNATMTVNGVAKSIGIKNIDLSGFNYYLNFDEKYLEADSGEPVLTSSDTLSVTYEYDIPILVAVENSASIAQYGQKEFAIFDNTITTSDAARSRASAELTDYANTLIEGTFKTLTPGWYSGMAITINLSAYGINATYYVQKVTAVSLGGGIFEYQIDLASAKTLGIIRFLVELLEQTNNNVSIATNETVDNLLSVNDSILSDSITDALTIDSAGAYSTWSPDSISTTPKTIAKWDLFEWK